MKISYHYGKGHITVLLPAFLELQGISKIRKLLSFIETSDTPDEMQKVAAYIKAENDSFDSRMKSYAHEAVAARTKAAELRQALERLIAARERYRKKSEPYKFLSAEIKAVREEIRCRNADFRYCEKEIKRLQRNKEKFRKIM